jgi:hypothetical protein
MNAQRAGVAREAFRRTKAAAAASPASAAAEPTPLQPAPAARAAQGDVPTRSKYTLLLSESDALMWDQLATQMRRDLHRRVDKSAIVRALVYLASEDADLRRQVAEQIAQDATP